MTHDDKFRFLMKVGEGDCDASGIVNNAVYLSYLERARHEFLRQHLRWDLHVLAEQGIGFVLARVEIDYLRSLGPEEDFIVETALQRQSGKSFLFSQDIYKLRNNKLVASARSIATSINLATGRSEVSGVLDILLAEKYPLPQAAESD